MSISYRQSVFSTYFSVFSFVSMTERRNFNARYLTIRVFFYLFYHIHNIEMLLNIYMTITLDYFFYSASTIYTNKLKERQKLRTCLLKQLNISQIGKIN